MKRIRGLWCVIGICLCLFGIDATVSADIVDGEDLTINIHYIRYNQDYEGWSLWLWTNDKDGKDYELIDSGTQYGAKTQIVIPAAKPNQEIGTLLKYKDWEEKDVHMDRYLDLSKAENGILNVYFLQETQEIYYTENQFEMKTKIIQARMDNFTSISFRAYTSEPNTDLRLDNKVSLVSDSGEEYGFTLKDVTLDGNIISGMLLLEAELLIDRCYYLSIDKSDKKAVSAGDVFSTKEFEEKYDYTGGDLGAVYSKESTAFRVWAPTAQGVDLNLFEEGSGDCLIITHPMKKDVNGTWYLKLEGDYDKIYYTYLVTIANETSEAVDPYARAVGINGKRGMIIDLDKTNPDGFLNETRPATKSASDIILYEMSVRDFTIDKSSGVTNGGTYLGLAQTGTFNAAGESTGLDYLKELGVTHAHLLPTQDFEGIDEEEPKGSYNWGYNPVNFNAPEGSYSTDPYHGEIRINEYKQMVKAMHESGVQVVMDVVYNHTYYSDESNFNKIVPGYYHRIKNDGSYSDGSACGNEVASERAMVRKFIVDSVVYWANEYHIDGFRFDLMGLIDVETMNRIHEELSKINPNIFIYGEGWTGGDTICEEEMAESENAKNMPEISIFSNVFRRGIQKYVSGIFEEEASKNSVLFGVVGATENEKTKQSMGSWTASPMQCINYSSCHDGYTLWDLIRQNCPDDTEEEWKSRNKLSAAIVLTVQGIPFIHSGEEILRMKVGDNDPARIYGNSYNAGDDVNSIKWDTLAENEDITAYYKGLMAFRKEHKGLRYETTKEIQEKLIFTEEKDTNVISYTVVEDKNIFQENIIYLIYNPNDEEVRIPISKGRWKVFVNNERAGTDVLEIISKEAITPPISAMVMVKTQLNEKTVYGLIIVGVLLMICGGIYAIKCFKDKRERGEMDR